MKKSYLIAIVAICSLTACGPSAKDKEQQALLAQKEQQFKDSVAKATKEAELKAHEQDSIAKAKVAQQKAEAAQDKQAAAIIRKLFAGPKEQAGIYPDYTVYDNNCTERLQKKLRDEYYDEYEDYGYAIWDFRTGVQDGDGPTKITSITPLGDKWYRYDFLDMGFKGAKKVHFVIENGSLKMDKLITIK